jgi:aryl-alcohol dehydrogenase-like predicted oxidoreductase
MWWEAYTVDREARDWYEQTQFPLFAWSSAGGGWFAGATSPDVKRVYENEENVRRLARAKEVAEKKGVTPYQIALAWTLNQPLNAWALVGPDTIEQLQVNMATVNLTLSPEELHYLELGG